MRKLKRISALLSIVLCMSMLLGMGTVSASTDNARYISCPGGGKHYMRPVGRGICRIGPSSNPGKIDFGGTLSQCQQCSIYMISESYPGNSSRSLGKYTVDSSPQSYEGSSTIFGGAMGTYYSGDNNPFIAGFDFKMT